jgi:hypothetical protein
MAQKKPVQPKLHGGTFDPTIFPGQIEHLPDHKLLFCHVHKQVVPLSQLEAHLFRTHSIPKPVRRLLLDHCSTLDVIRSEAELLDRPDSSPVIPAIPLYDNSYACSRCRFLTISYGAIMKHLNTAHSIYRSACKDHFTRVQLQSWYSGPRAKYWIVRTDNTGYDPNHQVLLAEQEEAELLEKFEHAEIQRLLLQERDDASWDAEVESSDTTPWLQYTKWPQQFAHRPLEVIAAAARRLESYPCDDYLLGFWNGSELRSPVEDEIKIQALLCLLEKMFQRCHETLDSSSHQLRCWVKSFKADVFYPYPLKSLQCQNSRDGYIGL